MSRIFTATDLSAAADEAIRQAHERAAGTGADLIICHVIPTLMANDPFFVEWNLRFGEKMDELRESSISQLSQRITEITGRKDDEFQILLGEGDAASVLVDQAEKLDAECLVLGSYGATGAMRILLGSVADKVIRYAHCPVLLARGPSDGGHTKTGKILVATDFSDASLPAVHLAAEEARRTKSHLTILHSIDSKWLSAGYPGFGFPGDSMNPIEESLGDLRKRINEKLMESLREVQMEGDRVIAEDPPAAAIVRTAEQIGAELVVVGSIGRTGLRRLLLGSVAEQVARTAPCSVLIVRLHRNDRQK